MYNLIHYINEYFEIELCNWGKFYKYDWLIRSNYSLNIIRRSIAVAMIKYIIKPFQLYWFDQPDMIWSPSNTKKVIPYSLKKDILETIKLFNFTKSTSEILLHSMSKFRQNLDWQKRQIKLLSSVLIHNLFLFYKFERWIMHGT